MCSSCLRTFRAHIEADDEASDTETDDKITHQNADDKQRHKAPHVNHMRNCKELLL